MSKPEKKTHALSIGDVERLDDILSIVNPELEKQGMKRANRTTILRALIFSKNKIKTEDLIDGIKKAQIYA